MVQATTCLGELMIKAVEKCPSVETEVEVLQAELHRLNMKLTSFTRLGWNVDGVENEIRKIKPRLITAMNRRAHQVYVNAMRRITKI